MRRFEMWGNKKNIQSENGKIFLTEAQEQEFKELGIITEDGILVDKDGVKSPYYIRENGCRVFQFHIPREEWGKTYNLYSEKVENGRVKVIYVPDKARFEIWENFKGEKRKMVLRSQDVNEVVAVWNDTYESDIDVDILEASVR